MNKKRYYLAIAGLILIGIGFLLVFAQNGSELLLGVSLLTPCVGVVLFVVAVFYNKNECESTIVGSVDEEITSSINYDFLYVDYDKLADIDYQSFVKEDVLVLKNQKGFNSVEGGIVTHIDSDTHTPKKASIYYNFQAIKIVFNDNTSICSFKSKYSKYDINDYVTAPFSAPLYTVILDNGDSFRFERKKDKEAFVQYFKEYNHFLERILSEIKNETIQSYNNFVVNDKINNMVNNFLEVIDENLFLDFQLNKVFIEQYLQRNELCNLFLQDLKLLQSEYTLNGLIYDYQTFSAFNKLLAKEVQIEGYKVELLSYLLLRNGVINKYSMLWQEKYDDSKDDDEDTNEYIYRCFDTNIIDKQDGYGYALLAYYILKQKDNIYDVFSNEVLNIQRIVQKVNEKQQKELFEKQIFKVNTTETINNTVTKPQIDDVDMMTGAEFENFICILYRKMGYNAYVTKASGDQGLDVIAEKNDKRIGIQAKCYACVVGNSAIQEAVAGKNYYNCDRVVVVTNSSFTKSAVDLANANNVVLWNRDILKEKINELF